MNTGLTSSTATGNGSHLKNKDEVYLKRLKSLQYFKDVKISEKAHIFDWRDIEHFDKEIIQSLTSNDMKMILSPSKTSFIRTNSAAKIRKVEHLPSKEEFETYCKTNNVQIPEFKIDADDSYSSDGKERSNSLK